MSDREQSDSESETGVVPALRFNNFTEERLQFTKQLGVSHVIIHPYEQSYIPEEDTLLSTESKWTFEELLHCRNFVEDRGLTLGAIENFPLSFYDDIMLGRSGRAEQLENVKESIRNMGRAGIDTLGYNWLPNRVWRSSLEQPGRGGATSTAFELADVESAPLTHDRTYDAEEMWEHYQYFLEEVLPVAEAEGVTLCLHPDDPPVPSLGGIARIFRRFEDLQRAMELVPSDNHRMELGLGVLSEMDSEHSVTEMVEHFADRDEIGYVHFRDVEGPLEDFQEVFIDEGNYDEEAVVQSLIDGGFEGMIIPDHVPDMAGERDWGPSGRAFTIGYLRGLLRAHGATPAQ